MKLLTICNKSETQINLKHCNEGLTYKEYSIEEYNAFVEIAKKYYVHKMFYWYETDMSDHDSGTINYYKTINQSNMIIKDNNFYGVLVKTNGMFPEYRILNFKQGHQEAALGGGYNSLDYDWWIKEKDTSNLKALEVSSKYIVVEENISYLDGKISIYQRIIEGFFPSDCIIVNDNIIGLKYKKENVDIDFIFNDKDSLINKSISEQTNSKSVVVRRLYEINDKFLESNIFEVTYEDFKKGNYKILNY